MSKSEIYPISLTSISYILEEWHLENTAEVNFAWSFPTQEEAEVKLLKEMREHGNTMAYRLYMSLDVWGHSSVRV